MGTSYLIEGMKTRKWPWQQHSSGPFFLNVIQQLQSQGFEAFLVGGAVRDHLMDRAVTDLDIATSARPQQVQGLFEKVIMVGESFGVCRVVVEDHVFEVATFRSDGPSADGRRPQSVEFVSAKEDALRRDFTVNGLFMDVPSGEIIDHVGGLKDLKEKRLRTIGDAALRFSEDFLRILRGLRFYSQLELDLDRDTEQAMAQQSPGIKNLAKERLYSEWTKLLLGARGNLALQKSVEFDIWPKLFSDEPFGENHWEHFFCGQFKDPDLLWNLFLFNQWKGHHHKIINFMEDWKMPGLLRKKTSHLLGIWEFLTSMEKNSPQKVALHLGHPFGAFSFRVFQVINGFESHEGWKSQLRKAQGLLFNGQLPQPKVTGRDLIEVGISPGPAMADILKELLMEQLVHPDWNQAQLLESLKK